MISRACGKPVFKGRKSAFIKPSKVIAQLEQKSMVHHHEYPLFDLKRLPLDQGHTKCSSVPST